MFDWITGIVEAAGYAGIALLMFLENVFPPIPSELIMPLAGFAAARGELSLAGVILAGSAGSFAGAMCWYWIGRSVGAERLKRLTDRHGRILTMTPTEVDRATDWFHQHGAIAVLTGRMVPAVRTLISVPAGVARMPLWRFAAWSALGTLAWTTLLAVAGHQLGRSYALVADWIDPISLAVIVLLVVGYLWRVATWNRRVRPRA